MIILGFLLLLLAVPSYAAETAVIQQAARTTAGTQDFTSSGFGTPKAVMCMTSLGATNGTSVTHGAFGIGFTDGTRQASVSARMRSGVTTTVTARRADTVDTLMLTDQTGTVVMRIQFSAWITDGVRLNYSVAPATAYQVSCTLFGGAGISNAYVDTVATPGTIDTGTTVTAPGFQPDAMVIIGAGDNTFNNTNASQSDISVGFVVRGGSNPHPQDAISWLDVNGVATTNVQSRTSSDRSARVGNGSQQVEIQDFTSTGFSAFTRTIGASMTVAYLALKFNGVSATALGIDSPTATGSRATSGLAGTPQWGMMVANAVTAVDNTASDGNAETFGVSSFTSAAQSCFSISSDDAVTTTSTDSLVDAKPLCLRKDAALFYEATFTSFTSGTSTLNYGTANGTLRKWAGLFLSTQVTGRSRGGVINFK